MTLESNQFLSRNLKTKIHLKQINKFLNFLAFLQMPLVVSMLMEFPLMQLKEKFVISLDLFPDTYKQDLYKNSLQMGENSTTVLLILKTVFNQHVVYRLYKDISLVTQISKEFEFRMENQQSCFIREVEQIKTNKIIIFL